MKYYRLNDDVEYPNRWYLGDILGVDNWELIHSTIKVTAPLDVELFQNGDGMDFTLSEVYGIPIVSKKVKKELVFCHDLDFIPVNIAKESCKEPYFVMIIQRTIDCVDENNSEFQKFENNDPVRPDKAGEFRAFMKLRLDTSKIVNADIFRLTKFETAIIISERIKNRLESAETKGLELTLVV